MILTRNITTLIGALLVLAAPSFSQTPPPAKPALWLDPMVKAGSTEPQWFLLTEDREQVGQRLGKPVQVTDFAKDLFGWQYQYGRDDEDYSHYAVFRKSTGKLVSITREYEPERTVDEFFPPPETIVCHYPDAIKPQYSVRARRLSGGRVMMAMGTSKPGQKTGQILLIRESELGNFYPWIEVQLAGAMSAKP